MARGCGQECGGLWWVAVLIDSWGTSLHMRELQLMKLVCMHGVENQVAGTYKSTCGL